MTVLASIDTTALANVVLASIAGSVVIIGAYALALYAGTHADEVRRRGHTAGAALLGRSPLSASSCSWARSCSASSS